MTQCMGWIGRALTRVIRQSAVYAAVRIADPARCNGEGKAGHGLTTRREGRELTIRLVRVVQSRTTSTSRM